MSNTFDVCIRGDGVVGRTMALLLAKERLRVALVAPAAHAEKSEKKDIRAYALNGASRQMLQTLRAWPEEDFATPVLKMQVWGDDGGKVDFNTNGQSQAALAWIVDVPELEEQLAQACRYQGQIERVEQPAPAALSIICEGQKSTSRSAVGAQWTRRPYTQKAMAARLESSLPHGGTARQWFAGGVSGGDVLALLPMGGTLGNSMALVWSVSDERAASLEQLAPDAFCAELASICCPSRHHSNSRVLKQVPVLL